MLWLYRTFWLLVLLSSLAWMVGNVYNRVSRYQQHATSTNVQVEYHPRLPFPAVTFCNKNIARYVSHLGSKLELHMHLNTEYSHYFCLQFMA